mmetsp:Transcript_2968/g.6728  ORF Transcript_2968/g.6728 Transcript_2968/m.6728 type:complete len:257 (+) Transcript_2968:2058-2828(+)
MIPYDKVLLSAFCFHSGAPSNALMLMLRSSCAKCRSPASGRGSSHGLLRSLGMESTSWFAWACRSSRRSLASVPCCIAALCNEPSGFLTMRIGSRSLPERRVCPRKKEGSKSASSTSVCSSVTSCASIPNPPSLSKVGYCSTGSTPDLINCCASNNSCSVSCFALLTPPSLPPILLLFIWFRADGGRYVLSIPLNPCICLCVIFSASSSSCLRFKAATSKPGWTTTADADAAALPVAILILDGLLPAAEEQAATDL